MRWTHPHLSRNGWDARQARARRFSCWTRRCRRLVTLCRNPSLRSPCSRCVARQVERVVGKLIGYARVSTRGQVADRQEADLFAAGVRRDDLYIDHGVSGARASRPAFDRALSALHAGDTLVITTLDRLGRSTANMLALADRLRDADVSLRVLNLGGGAVDTATPVGSMLFTVMAALAQMELEIKRERDHGLRRQAPCCGQGPRRSAAGVQRQPAADGVEGDRERRAGRAGRPRHGDLPRDVVSTAQGRQLREGALLEGLVRILVACFSCDRLCGGRSGIICRRRLCSSASKAAGVGSRP